MKRFTFEFGGLKSILGGFLLKIGLEIEQVKVVLAFVTRLVYAAYEAGIKEGLKRGNEKRS